MHRKGFPESYDRRKLMRFVTAVKSGSDVACAPVYSHLLYDIVPGEKQIIEHPDILILEGLNVLQTGPALMVSDLFDFSVYVDAHRGHRELVHLAVPVDARRGVRRSGVALPSLLHADRRGGRVRRPRHLAFDQPAQPDREHPADEAAGDAGVAQGPDH